VLAAGLGLAVLPFLLFFTVYFGSVAGKLIARLQQYDVRLLRAAHVRRSIGVACLRPRRTAAVDSQSWRQLAPFFVCKFQRFSAVFFPVFYVCAAR
jgi:hypothetical protein